MNNRLILIEGIPGSGKTTLARWLGETQCKSTFRVFLEGEQNPADLAWRACIPADEWKTIAEAHPEIEKQQEGHVSWQDGWAIIAYTELNGLTPEMRQYFEQHELYDGREEEPVFRNLHYARWRRFAEEAVRDQCTYVFESVFLQNHVNEMLLFRRAAKSQILDHLRALIEPALPLNPVLIYLDSPCVEDTVSDAARVRTDENGRRTWAERVAEYVERSPYGRANGLLGYEGMVRYFQMRKGLEIELAQRIGIDYKIVRSGGDRETMISEILNACGDCAR